jgi:hypothetical protein
MGFNMMWQNVRLEKEPYKCNQMIKDILLLQPYLSAYYEATNLIVEKQQQDQHQQQNEDSRNLNHKEYNNNNTKF